MNNWIYHFTTKDLNKLSNNDKFLKHTNTKKNYKTILGNKGTCLSDMVNLGLSTPPGFILTTQLCKYYYDNNKTLPDTFLQNIEKSIKRLEKVTQKSFGKSNNPLIVSVRSSGQVSMPGMMDTILNLGLNSTVINSMIENTCYTKKFVHDIYLKFLKMYCEIVLNISVDKLIIESSKSELIIETLENILTSYDKKILSSPLIQLELAIKAILNSWMSERAKIYRKLNKIHDSLGTAVIIQSMVFGNINNKSATGVLFTRSPTTGEKKIFGEFLVNAQGEEIVSGTHTPLPIINSNGLSLKKMMPKIFNNLNKTSEILEIYYKDVQDIEFTIENNRLYILQTRTAKRSTVSTIKTSVDMVTEKLITIEEAINRIKPELIINILHARIDYTQKLIPVAQGLPASPGAAVGVIAFTSEEAELLSKTTQVILVRNETSPEDILGMSVSAGIITKIGGVTSHAAVIARGIGKPCICGINDLIIDIENKTLKIGNTIIQGNAQITIDGSEGKVFIGQIPLIKPNIIKEFYTILKWSKNLSKLHIRANAETVEDIQTALEFGATGIGLCRTEHMLYDTKKLSLFQQIILNDNNQTRSDIVNQLSILQINDFKSLFRAIKGYPINIRLLDPPLHEFISQTSENITQLSEALQVPFKTINERLKKLIEVNPMLGNRGCRLGISYPEIYKMQIHAMFTAMYELKLEENLDTKLEIMIPFVSDINEIKIIKKYIKEIEIQFLQNYSFITTYSIGTMIELPRAALLANHIAQEVNFLSFGTNDLTQTTYGISRDDIAKFLNNYLENKIFNFDPFEEIDIAGVGRLIKHAIKQSKIINKNIKYGICGEHAGNAKSIDFFNNIGINYISCSPYRVPIAQIASAQVNIKSKIK